MGIKYYLLGEVLKENVDSWFCFLDIAERKPRARELCSSYNLLDVNAHTMCSSAGFKASRRVHLTGSVHEIQGEKQSA